MSDENDSFSSDFVVQYIREVVRYLKSIIHCEAGDCAVVRYRLVRSKKSWGVEVAMRRGGATERSRVLLSGEPLSAVREFRRELRQNAVTPCTLREILSDRLANRNCL